MKYSSGLNGLDLNAKPDSIWDIIQTRAEELGVKTFLNFIDHGEQINYRDAYERSAAIGLGLREFGVKSGERVGLLLSGSPLHVYAWFATLGAAMVDVPINTEFRGEVLDHAIQKIEVTAAFADEHGLEALESASPEVREQLSIVVVTDPVFESAMQSGKVPKGIQRFVSLSQVEDAGRASRLPPADIDSRGLASIRFSSGTTGLPKGVMMDHGHMLASARKFNDMMDFGREDTMYTCFPFHHVFATITGVLSTMCAAGTMVVAKKFSASRYWQDIRDHGVTRAHLLDPLVPLLMKQPPSELDRKHQIPVMYTAAGHYPEFEERFDVRIISIYDMSELTVVAHYPEDLPRRPGSCGISSGLFDIAILDENGCEVPVGSDGEIAVRPKHPSLMFMGYYNDADQTVERFRDLWFHTGDRGKWDEDGYFYFLGRVGDRIRRRGVNISAEQVELIALQNPIILECAAIAVPSDLPEDEIKLCARLVDGATASPAEIADKLAATLPKAMTVRYVEIYEWLPKTQTEKVQRAQLRKHGERGLTPTTWDHEQHRFWTAGA
ncbi:MULTISPECIES: AMP-binding protein [Paraburkholderia]|uniref:AMP-binding protein n=1 Tax=Paraburkholderia madseniana TaxID=2599607 RepID=A0AAP5EYA8_9BURK|nr:MULTISPECIES: AMP-binding protein [Paraburkholderia]MCX4149982.1 AMP-binding protein [Paraburkholderia madseniana]MDN7152918.1 AMP-binding protein [Paraburkholderia sp. WS6]MDQ6411800.1 AMP-binding protein [Paraburkholderia madseniana]